MRGLIRRFAPVPANTLMADAVAFQTDLEEIIEEFPSRMLRVPVYALAGLLAAMLAIACLVKVDKVVPASGQLMADEPPIVLQPMERGQVRRLLVKPGDVVRQGQVLALLDPTLATADLDSLIARRRMLGSRMRRLGSELAGQPFAPLPEDGPDGPLQASLHAEAGAQLRGRLLALDEQIGQDREAQRAAAAGLPLLSSQATVAENVAAIRAQLYQAQVGSKLQLLDALSARLGSEHALRDATHRVQELAHAIAARRADRQAAVDAWRQERAEMLARDRAEADGVDEQLVKARRMRALVTITAPRDGTVLEVADRAAGSTVREGEKLVTLMPADAPLIADVMVESSELGAARPGAEVLVKVDAFSFQQHGMLRGRLRAVGQQSFAQHGAGSAESGLRALNEGPGYHRAQIALTTTALHGLPAGARLLPGMTVTADIKAGSRRLISYFLTPISQGFEESFREPG